MKLKAFYLLSLAWMVACAPITNTPIVTIAPTPTTQGGYPAPETPTALAPTGYPAPVTKTALPTIVPSATPTLDIVEGLMFFEAVPFYPDEVPSIKAANFSGKLTVTTINGETRNYPESLSMLDRLSPTNLFKSVGPLIASPNGQKVVFWGWESNQTLDGIYLLDLATKQLTRLPLAQNEMPISPNNFVNGPPADLVWTYDSQRIAGLVDITLSSNLTQRQIFTWQIGASDIHLPFQEQLSELEKGEISFPFAPRWSSNGDYLAFAYYSGNAPPRQDGDLGKIYIGKFETGELRLISDSAFLVMQSSISSINSPAWSPNNKWVAYLEGQKSPKIRLTNIDTGESRWLTSLAIRETNPIWLPSGEEILFTSEDHGKTNLYIANVNTGEGMRLTPDLVNDVNPVLSLSGRFVAFLSDRKAPSEGYHLYVMTTDGADTRSVFSGYVLFPPTWINLSFP